MSDFKVNTTSTPRKNLKLAQIELMNLNDDCLLHLLRFFDLLELLDLHGICRRLDNLILKNFTRFETLNFNIVHCYSKEKFVEIFQFVGPYIKSLETSDELHYVYNNDNNYLLELINEYCVNLENLRFDFLEFTIIQKFIPIVNRLKSLTMSGPYFGDDYADCFTAACLEELNVCDNQNLTKNFFKNCSNLKALTISHCPRLSSDAYIEILKQNLSLKQLKICKLGMNFFQAIPKFLKDSDDLVEFIANNLHEIEDLSLNVAASNLSLLADLPNLKKLEIIQSLEKLTVDQSFTFPEMENLLEKLIQKNIIEELHIENSGYEIKVDLVCQLTKLKKLTLEGTKKLEEVDLVKLQNLGNLVSLEVDSRRKETCCGKKSPESRFKHYICMYKAIKMNRKLVHQRSVEN